MNIGILGSGLIGATAARLFIKSGREVAIGNSRGADSLQPLIHELGTSAHALTSKEAARFGPLVLLAIPLHAFKSLDPAWFKERIVIDATNYYPKRDGRIPELETGDLTSSELIASHLSGARLVKSFNTMYYEHLASRGNVSELIPNRLALFLAADDAAAKSTVAGLIEDIGFAPIDTGSLREGGRKQQPGSPIYNHPVIGRDALQLLEKA